MDDYEKEELSSLKSLVSDVLQKRGVLGKIQAQLRSSVFAVLQESDENGLEASSLKTRAILASPQGRNALYLVRDLLAYLELEYTLSVFDPEIGYHDRDIEPTPLTTHLSSLTEKSPLLVTLINEYTRLTETGEDVHAGATSPTLLRSTGSLSSIPAPNPEQRKLPPPIPSGPPTTKLPSPPSPGSPMNTNSVSAWPPITGKPHDDVPAARESVSSWPSLTGSAGNDKAAESRSNSDDEDDLSADLAAILGSDEDEDLPSRQSPRASHARNNDIFEERNLPVSRHDSSDEINLPLARKDDTSEVHGSATYEINAPIRKEVADDEIDEDISEDIEVMEDDDHYPSELAGHEDEESSHPEPNPNENASSADDVSSRSDVARQNLVSFQEERRLKKLQRQQAEEEHLRQQEEIRKAAVRDYDDDTGAKFQDFDINMTSDRSITPAESAENLLDHVEDVQLVEQD